MERDNFATAVRVMEQVSKASDPVGVRELSRALGMAVGSTHRALQALMRERFVVQARARGLYSSGARIFELASNLVRAHDLVPVAGPFLQQTAQKSHESVVLMIVDSNEALCVASIDSEQVLRTVFPVGWRGPLYWGASGRLLLAYQPEETIRTVIRGSMRGPPPHRVTDPDQLLAKLATIKRSGYAVSHGERAHGMTSVAAAVRGPNRLVVASVAMYGPSARFSRTKLPKYLALVRRCADGIGEALLEQQNAYAKSQPAKLHAPAGAAGDHGQRRAAAAPASSRRSR